MHLRTFNKASQLDNWMRTSTQWHKSSCLGCQGSIGGVLHKKSEYMICRFEYGTVFSESGIIEHSVC